MAVSALKVDTTAASCRGCGLGTEPAGCSSKGVPSTTGPRTAPGNDGTHRATTWTSPGGSRDANTNPKAKCHSAPVALHITMGVRHAHFGPPPAGPDSP